MGGVIMRISPESIPGQGRDVLMNEIDDPRRMLDNSDVGSVEQAYGIPGTVAITPELEAELGERGMQVLANRFQEMGWPAPIVQSETVTTTTTRSSIAGTEEDIHEVEVGDGSVVTGPDGTVYKGGEGGVKIKDRTRSTHYHPDQEKEETRNETGSDARALLGAAMMAFDRILDLRERSGSNGQQVHSEPLTIQNARSVQKRQLGDGNMEVSWRKAGRNIRSLVSRRQRRVVPENTELIFEGKNGE